MKTIKDFLPPQHHKDPVVKLLKDIRGELIDAGVDFDNPLKEAQWAQLVDTATRVFEDKTKARH